MATWDNIALALQGFGAGVEGRGPEFLRGLNEDRKKAMVQDAFKVKDLLEKGEVSNARKLVLDRNKRIEQLGGDNSDTTEFLNLLDTGNIEGAISEASVLINAGISQGLLTDPNTATIRERELQSRIDQNKIANELATQRLAFQQQQAETQAKTSAAQLAYKTQQAKTQAEKDAAQLAYDKEQDAIENQYKQDQLRKISPGLEKQLLTAQDNVVVDQRNANKYDTLASDYERVNIEGGLKSTWSEFIKGALGTQDDVTEFKRNFNQVRISEGLKNLPPGPATDRDVKEAMKGVPAENASAETIASFLRGAAKLSRFNAGYNQFKADYIDQKRSGAGLNRVWRTPVSSPKLTEKVTVGEIYSMAQDMGVSPEKIAKDLEIDLYGGVFK